jgi:iron(III) transport system permease protein
MQRSQPFANPFHSLRAVMQAFGTPRRAANRSARGGLSLWSLGLRLFAVIVVGLVLLPLLYLVIRALGAGERGVALLVDPRTLMVIANSLLLAGGVVLASTLIGVPFAWLTARTNLPGRRFWLVAGLLPLVIPSYIGAMAFIAAFGSKGMLQQLLEPFGVTQLPSIYGFFGAWLAVTFFTYPYVVLPVRAALLNMDPALEETAHSLGFCRKRVFLRVTLPQLRPALAIGMLLSALYTLSDFGAVALMQYDAFTRVIYQQYRNSFDRHAAAILSLILVVIAIALLIVERRVAAAAAKRNFRIGVGATRRMRTIDLGKWKLPALAFCASIVGIGLVVPLVVLGTWLARTVTHTEAAPDLFAPTLNAIGASGFAAIAAAVLALPLAILAVRSKRMSGSLVQLAYLGNGLPGIVVALALVFFAANYLPWLYQTLPVLVFGYVVRFLPLSVGATRSALSQVNPRIEEAGRSLGQSPLGVARRITFPMIRTGAMGGMALVFLSAMKELPTTLLLMPTGFKTLATEIWTARDVARFSQLAGPSLLLIAVSALSLLFILRRDVNNHVH